MVLSQYIRRLLTEKSNADLSIPTGSEQLSLDIEKATGNHIGVNTLKRLLGLIPDERQPRITTLNLIARYLGYNNWTALSELDDRSNSSFGTLESEANINAMQRDDRIEIEYLPNRRIILSYRDEGWFDVADSANSKLLKGDSVHISHIVNDYPLLIDTVMRDGKNLGAFTAGRTQGIRWKLVNGNANRNA